MIRTLNILAWIAVGIFGVLTFLVLLVPALEARFIYGSASDLPTTTVAMVLGASVYENGRLSPILRERADRGAELYLLGKVKKILVTGDNGALSHNEVNPVGNYLLLKGVPRKDIFLDHAGFDTYSSVYRAKEVFGVHDVVIVSQPFHLARALLIARHLGLEAYGIEAGNGKEILYSTVREMPATLKAIFDLGFARIPKYLGPKFPIEGDGTLTWN